MYTVNNKSEYRYTIMFNGKEVMNTNTVEILHSVWDLLLLTDDKLEQNYEDDEFIVLVYKNGYRIIIRKYYPECVLAIEQ